jgi:radical SAM protein with 4Fe4S-binding SPASM domain
MKRKTFDISFSPVNIFTLFKSNFLSVQLKMKLHIPLFQRVVIELQSNCNRDCYFCSRQSDTSGKRRTPEGKRVSKSMPAEKVMKLLDELQSLNFKGYITFHHLSEAFLDNRLIQIATEAKKRGMRPYIHTNGDVLRNNEELCKKSAEVFEYVVVGLYDYNNQEEKEDQKEFWIKRLHGTTILFSVAEKTYRRTYSPDNEKMGKLEKKTYPAAICANPQKYLLIHYNGDVSCCCEDMYGELMKSNIFDKSIKEIWYSEEHKKIIKELQGGERKKYDLCLKCTMGPNSYSQYPMDDTNHYDR